MFIHAVVKKKKKTRISLSLKLILTINSQTVRGRRRGSRCSWCASLLGAGCLV